MPKRHLHCPLMPWLLAGLGALATGCDSSVDDNVFVSQPRQVTYHDDVAPLLDDICSDCHDDGSEVRFDDYDAAAAWSDAMVDVVLGASFHPPLMLDDDEVETILAWHEGGRARGTPTIPAEDDDDE